MVTSSDHKIPNVFISYSHDSESHKSWVLEFATKLREHGIEAILDVWELRPGSDLTHFMESNLVKADFVLMICTPDYVKKANSGIGGVGYEKMIVTAELLENINSGNIIPIVRSKLGKPVPTFLGSKLYVDLSDSNKYQSEFNTLVSTLHHVSIISKPVVKPRTDIPNSIESTVDAHDLTNTEKNHATSQEKILKEPTKTSSNIISEMPVDENTSTDPQTVCTNCQTVFDVPLELLSTSDTRVRCGECLSIFDALASLRQLT